MIFKLGAIIVISLLCNRVQGVFNPSNDDDWTKLKPAAKSPPGSFQSVSFKFGLVVNAYEFRGSNEKELPNTEDSGSYGAYDSPTRAVSCATSKTLVLTLKNSILRDAINRIGSIVADRQFQFDGPPPQHGTLYASGWSITNDGKLSLGESTTFYQCASGEYYNLYDHPIAYQCNPVTLDVVEIIKC